MSAKWFTTWCSMKSTHYDSVTGYLQISHGTFTLTVCKCYLPYSTIVLHSFYYIFRFRAYFHCSASIPYRGQKANWLERKFLGTFAPGNEGSRELSFLGAKVPTGNFRSWEWKYRGAKSPDTTPKVFRVYGSTTRGNVFKLDKGRAKYDLRKYYFTNRVVNAWNSLP